MITLCKAAGALALALIALSISAGGLTKEQKKSIHERVQEKFERSEQATTVPKCDYFAAYGAFFAYMHDEDDIYDFLHHNGSTSYGNVLTASFAPMGAVIVDEDLSVPIGSMFARIVCERNVYTKPQIKQVYEEVYGDTE